MDDNKRIEELEQRVAELEDKLNFIYGIGRSERLGAYLKKMKRVSAAAAFVAESLGRPEIAEQVAEIQNEELRNNFGVENAEEAGEYISEANKMYEEENKRLDAIIENLKNSDSVSSGGGSGSSAGSLGSDDVSRLVKDSDMMYGYSRRSDETIGLLKDENSLFDFSDSKDAWMEAYSNLDDDDYDEYDNYDLTSSAPAPVEMPEEESLEEKEEYSAEEETASEDTSYAEENLNETDSSLFEFSKTDGGIKIDSYKGSDEKNIVIPSNIDGSDVVEIGANAFNKINTIDTVVLPDTVKKISDNAFNTPSLKKIRIPDSVTDISDNAFYHYHSDYNVTIYCNDGSDAIKYANKKNISKDNYSKFNA